MVLIYFYYFDSGKFFTVMDDKFKLFTQMSALLISHKNVTLKYFSVALFSMNFDFVSILTNYRTKLATAAYDSKFIMNICMK